MSAPPDSLYQIPCADNSPLVVDLRSLIAGERRRSRGVFRWSNRDAVTLKRAIGYLRYIRAYKRRGGSDERP